MIVSKAEIEQYIPQRAPFIMIDNLVQATPEKFETDFRILPNNIFIDEGILREFAVIENIAQTASAGLSVFNRYSGGEPVDGMIGSISKLKLYELPRVGETVYTVVYLVARLQNMFLLKGESFINERKLIECELKLVGIRKKDN